VLLHIEKAACIGVALHPLLGLGVVSLRAIAHCALAVVVAFGRVGSHELSLRTFRSTLTQRIDCEIESNSCCPSDLEFLPAVHGRNVTKARKRHQYRADLLLDPFALAE